MSSPVAPTSHPSLEARQSAIRDELFRNTVDVFAETGSLVTPMGSVSNGTPDAFSDVDVWVTAPDDRAPEIIAARHQYYGEIGQRILTWERPRFAPIGGAHSVVLYDDPRSELPVEVDFYMASKTDSEPYASVIDGTKLTQDHEWATGEDDPSLESSLSYCALVALWAAKYSSRGSDEEIDWALRRYHETRARHAGLPELDTPSDPGSTLDCIVRSLASCAENNLLVVACHKIRAAISVAQIIRNSRLDISVQ